MPCSQKALDQTGPSRAVFPPGGSPADEIMMPDPAVAEEFHIAISAVGTTSTIGPHGEWDLSGKAAASRAVAKALQRSPDRLVLDLSRLTFIDSSAVHAAIHLTQRSQAEDFHFAIVPGSRAVQRIFDICHLTETLPFTTRAHG
jgi:anti-anti-sigma factor